MGIGARPGLVRPWLPAVWSCVPTSSKESRCQAGGWSWLQLEAILWSPLSPSCSGACCEDMLESGPSGQRVSNTGHAK